jgi:hypothetical protein
VVTLTPQEIGALKSPLTFPTLPGPFRPRQPARAKNKAGRAVSNDQRHFGTAAGTVMTSNAGRAAHALRRFTRMTYIDSVLLDLTERFCRRFQVLTGRTNVWLAVQLTNLSIVVYFVWAGAHFWRSGVPTRVALGLFCAGLLYVLTQTVLKVPVEASEQSAYQRVARGYGNPRRLRDAMLRILFLMLSLMLAGPVLLVYVTLHEPIVLLGYSLVALTTVLLYVLACDPLPPCAGTVTEWLRLALPRTLAGKQRPATTTDRGAQVEYCTRTCAGNTRVPSNVTPANPSRCTSRSRGRAARNARPRSVTPAHSYRSICSSDAIRPSSSSERSVIFVSPA